MGGTNVPEDVVRMLRQSEPGVTERLLALTNATNNVTLKIDRGYPPPKGFGIGPDRREDPRITAAVEALFGKENQAEDRGRKR